MPRPLAGVGPDPRAIARPWIGSYPPGVPPTYRYPDVLLTRFLDDAARDFPDVTAVDGPDGSLRYPEVADLVDRLAAALETLGIGHGARLAALLPAGAAATVVTFAAWRLGAIVVPVDPERDDAEVHRRLSVTGARVLITEVDAFERVRSIRGALPHLHAIVVTSPGDWQPRLRRLLGGLTGGRAVRKVTARDDVLAWSEVLDREPARRPQRHAEANDVATVLFDRDGEALAFTHRHLVAAAFQSRLWIPDVQAGKERVLAAAAVDHPQGLVAGVLDPVLSAATIVVARSRDVDEVSARIEQARPTLLRGPASLFAGIAGGDADVTSLRACLATSGSLDAATVERFGEVSRGARLRRAYGPTAGAGLTHANPVYGRALNDAIGLPVSDTVAVVVEPDDPERAVPVGTPGRLLVRGPQVTLRRWGQPEEDPGPGGTLGWLDTGDDAAVESDGWFTLLTPDAETAHATDGTPGDGGILTARPPAATTDDEDRS